MEGEGSSSGWSCATNWTVAKGSSLEASISFDTSDEDAPALTSDGSLLLRPASHDPPPCEVTVFFRGKHEIHRVYARTTARIFEIYYTKNAETNCTKEYLCTVKCGPTSSDSSVNSSEEESWVDVKAPGSPLKETRMHYEATAEISDAEPVASLTVRFLSLQTKSTVHVEEIYIYADPIDESGTTQDLSSSTTGNSNASSLFAMLVPNLLQMSKSGLSSKINERYFDFKDQNAKLDTSVTDQPRREEAVNHTEEKVDQEATINTDRVKVGPTSSAGKSVIDESANNRVEKILEQLVSKVDKIETYFTRFEEKMVGPISCIESRLERLENQFDLFTKDLQSLRRVPLGEPCSHDATDDCVADRVAGRQVETKPSHGTTFKAPECMSEDESDDDDGHDGIYDDIHDDLEVETHVPNKRKPISIDGALASALAAFATESNPTVSNFTSNKMNNSDFDPLYPFEAVPDTGRNDGEVEKEMSNLDEKNLHRVHARDVTSGVGPTEETYRDVSIGVTQIEVAFDPLYPFEAVPDDTGRNDGEVERETSNLDENLHRADARDVTSGVGPTEETTYPDVSIGVTQIEVAFDPLYPSEAVPDDTGRNDSEVEKETSNLDEKNLHRVHARDVTSGVGPTVETYPDVSIGVTQIEVAFDPLYPFEAVPDDTGRNDSEVEKKETSNLDENLHRVDARDMTSGVGPTEKTYPDASIGVTQIEADFDPLYPFEAVPDDTGRNDSEVEQETSNLDENLHRADARDITSGVVGPTEETFEGSHIHTQKEEINLDEDLHQVYGETTSEVGPTEGTIIEDFGIRSQIEPREPGLFSRSVIGEVSDEEEEIEPAFASDSPRFSCNSVLSSSDFEPSLPNLGEILTGWGGDGGSSSTDSSFHGSFLKNNTMESGTFCEGAQNVSVNFDELKMPDPFAVLLGETTVSQMHDLKENNSGANDPFIDLEQLQSSDKAGPTDGGIMPQFESLI